MLLVLLVAAPRPLLGGVSSPDPAGETRQMIAQALAILHNNHISPELRRRQLIQVAEGRLDFALMAQGALGSHWTELTPAQRETFVSLFAGFFEAAYLNKLQDYANLEIRIGDAKITSGGYASVDAVVLQPGSDDLPLTFMLTQRGNVWMVYDVEIENIGMIENYRAQFDRIIRAHGISSLMADLAAKQAQLGVLLGASHGASS
jgi:phospholipid transport system substrate-binding protein